MKFIFFLAFLVLFFVTRTVAGDDDADASLSSTTEPPLVKDILDDNDVIGNDEAFFLEGNETVTFVPDTSSDLFLLLQKHNLTGNALARMFPGTYFPANPRDSDSYPNYWKAEVVTPTPQGVNGSLVQAVLFSNEYRNPENPQRVLSFAGVFTRDLYKTANPESACLAANFGFKGTDAESAWQKTCFDNGYIMPNMADWAAQIRDLIQATKPTFLTGHKLGCDIAKSEGLLNPHLPVVCWGATGTLTEAWINAYPGLANATRWNDISSTEKLYPENDQIYVIQTLTDPNSNCLQPLETPGSGLAHVCAYEGQAMCDSAAPTFEYTLFSYCADRPSSYLGLFPVPEIFASCISREDVGFDTSLKYCPWHQVICYEPDCSKNSTSSTDESVEPLETLESENVTEANNATETAGSPSFGVTAASFVQLIASFLLTSIFLAS